MQITVKKSHDYDYPKLSKGPCIHELRRKNSCNATACRFNHQIPSVRRGNPKLIEGMLQSIKSSKNATQKTESVKSTDVCSTEFFGGTNSCKQKSCRKHIDHDLDFQKVRRGICLFEFFKKDSCTHKTRCHFTHKFPVKCLSDPVVIKLILRSINQYRKKDKIIEVLGRDIVDSAAKLMSLESDESVVQNDVHPKSQFNSSRNTPAQSTTSTIPNNAAKINIDKTTISDNAVGSSTSSFSTCSPHTTYSLVKHPPPSSICTTPFTGPVLPEEPSNAETFCNQSMLQSSFINPATNQTTQHHQDLYAASNTAYPATTIGPTSSYMVDSYNPASLQPLQYTNNPETIIPTSNPFLLTDLIKELVSKENQKYQYQNHYVM